MEKQDAVKYLIYLLRTYDGVTRMITATKNRLHAINPDADVGHQVEIKAMESQQGNLSRRIGKELDVFPIWTDWMQQIPGCGPYVAGNLIQMYYFKQVAICKKCGADLNAEFTCTGCGTASKGGGILATRIEDRDFPTISKWWAFMGRGIDAETGKMPKRSKGQKSNWSSRGRVVTFQLGDQFNRQKEDHPYKAFLLERRKRHLKTHPGASKGYNLNMSKHETIKLFLAHMWTVARFMDGKPVSRPYAGTIMGHTGIVEPFFFDHKISYVEDRVAA